jgi:KDO2-lipid IV(A) lauroyltransferase
MRRSRRPPKLRKTALHALGYGVLWILARVVGRLPFRAASLLGEVLGVLAYHLGTRERNRALRHLRLALGAHLSRGERRRIALSVFRNFGRAFAEAAAGARLPAPALEAHVENAAELRDHLRAVLGEGRGLIAMTGHLGNWELLGSLGARTATLSVVADRFRFEPYNRLAEALRASGGLKTIYLNENPREIVRALKRNEAVGLLPDQDLRRLPGTYVLFFGRPAWTPVGPVLAAKLSGAPMIPYFLVRRGPKYRVEIGDRIPVTFTGDRKKDLFVNTQRWSDVYEACIRKHPGQWAWNHLRWNTQPSEVPETFLRNAVLPAQARAWGERERAVSSSGSRVPRPEVPKF